MDQVSPDTHNRSQVSATITGIAYLRIDFAKALDRCKLGTTRSIPYATESSGAINDPLRSRPEDYR